MKTKSACISILIVIIISLAGGCSGNGHSQKLHPSQAIKTQVVTGRETGMLLAYLKENGDYADSKDYPSFIGASDVHDELSRNTLIIDLRSQAEYTSGHIKGAVNKKFEDLPAYFRSGLKPSGYEKIILVSEDGQISSYTTCLLRLMGYGNVYSMKWGMSGWNRKCAEEGWLKGISGNYESVLQTGENEKPSPGMMPDLHTGKEVGEEIAGARFHKLFEEDVENILVNAGEIFADPGKYFIINLDRRDKYEDGHIPGAVRYKPRNTLGYADEMCTIPSDRTVVLYCSTGQNAGFAAAYLRLMGYDARVLRYGNNSFMHDKMLKERVSLSWVPFTEAEIGNFELVK
jgi:rhodanese-related sulfurtransferase